MLKVIPVEEAIGMPLAHDITEIVPGKHKGPAFRRGHIVRQEDISKLLDVGKRHLYVMELGKDELHEEDAARRLARAAAGSNLKLTEPVEGRVNLVAEISGLLKIDADLLYRFNSLGDLMMATLTSNCYVKQGDVVAGTRTIPVVVKEALIQRAEILCKDHPIVQVLPTPARKIHLIVTGSEVYSGRIKDGFEPVVRKKVGEMGSDLVDKIRFHSSLKTRRKQVPSLFLSAAACPSIRTTKRPKGFVEVAPKWSRTDSLSYLARCSLWLI
jgi:hypothetical protein